MSEYIVQSGSLTAVANKIREKTGGSAPLEFPDDFISEIDTLMGIPQTPTDSILFYSPNVFYVGIYNKTKNWNGTVEYSTDHQTWTEWDGTTTLTAALSNSGNYLLYLKGTGNTVLSGSGSQRQGFEITGSFIKCVGNFANMLDSLDNYACSYLFNDCPTVDFDIQLPFTTLAASCYAHFFQGCSSLTKAPALPADTMVNGCYAQMFDGCISLQYPPELNAATVYDNCYRSMFVGCVSLLEAPALPATTVMGSCYAYMFSGCTKLRSTPTLSAIVMATSCYDHMFENCVSLTTAPNLPATTLAVRCYQNMFAGCKSLTSSVKLPATTLQTYCYSNMFNGCTDLESLPELPATTLTSNCYQSMFSGCSKIKISATQTGDYQTEYRIPSSGTGTAGSNSLTSMFASTGGTFTSNPAINTTYYTSNTVIPAT